MDDLYNFMEMTEDYIEYAEGVLDVINREFDMKIRDLSELSEDLKVA